MNLRSPRNINGIVFVNALMNGAYLHSKSKQDIKRLVRASGGAVVVGSITVKPRRMNDGRGYWIHKEGFYSLNSFGMPNKGLGYFQNALPDMVKAAHSHQKPLIANVAGFNTEEYVKLTKLAQESGADMVELNLACPNVWDKNEQKRIVCYHAPLVQDILDNIKKEKFKINICIKISPLPPDILKEVASVISRSGIVSAVTATNSYPNAATTYGTGKRADDKLSGLAGRGLKPISLGVVHQLRMLLPEHIAIIGCGGIYSVNDVNDYLEAGADAIQLASSLMDKGLSVFDSILQAY